MIYRLITVWIDLEDESGQRIHRAARDFSSIEEITEHIANIHLAGFSHANLQTQPMENGVQLLSVYVPLNRITGWFVWALPSAESMPSAGEWAAEVHNANT